MTLDNLDTYDYSDPFKPPSPEPSHRKPTTNNDNDDLGINEEVSITRTRAPAIKLDETRLLSHNGIPKLRRRAANLKFKGKGHEVRH